MKINNTTQIRAEGFAEEDRDSAERMGNILNPFMQQVVELSDGRIDFENRVENLIQFDMTVNASGVPLLNNKVNTSKGNIRGFQVIAAFNVANPNIPATSQPFITYNPIGNGLVQISNISGLPANQKFSLRVIVY